MYYKLTTNEYSLEFEANQELFDYLGFAERENKNRKFLFVSKVLGKHYPVTPIVMKRVFESMSKLIDKKYFNEHLLVIGMGETATGLGWGIFNEIKNQNKLYVHTTRLKLPFEKLLTFNEDHSHAPIHHIYAPQQTKHKILLSKIKNILIIDDEVTTGRTIANLEKQLVSMFPKVKVSSLCIVKWDVKNKLDIKGNIKALEYPQFFLSPKTKVVHNYSSIKNEELSIIKNVSFNKFGRFCSDKFILKNININVEEYKGKKVLVLGTGEFNYAAFWFAYKISKNADVFVQSTTRSPIKISGIIKSKLIFKDNYDPNITSYLYNVSDKKYDLIIIFAETQPGSLDKSLIKSLKQVAKKVIQIFC
jgi:pyrimidine operon attenuation protein/uracil phosphoribosyltransferase